MNRKCDSTVVLHSSTPVESSFDCSSTSSTSSNLDNVTKIVHKQRAPIDARFVLVQATLMKMRSDCQCLSTQGLFNHARCWMLLSWIFHTALDVKAFQSPGKLFLRTSYKAPLPNVCCLGSVTSSPAAATTSTESFGPAQHSRKPNYYWNNIENVRQELIEFWGNINVTSFPDNRPPIPSEGLSEERPVRRVLPRATRSDSEESGSPPSRRRGPKRRDEGSE